MRKAAAKDEEAVQNDQPALEKLKQYGPLLEKLQHYDLQEYILENAGAVLGTFAIWLRPGPSGLCALQVRKALLAFIDDLDLEMDRHLTSNDLGKVLMALRKHDDETIANKRKITVRPSVRRVRSGSS